jgi:hypothetical protein
MEKALIIGKRIECIIGIILLIPVIIGVIAFVMCLFKGSNDFCTLDNLSRTWSYSLKPFSKAYSNNFYAAAGAMSSAPIYLGLMAIAGVWLVKDSFKYFFMRSK